MAIDPLNIATPQAFSAFDFTPLMQLGKQYQQQQDQQQLASLGSTYGALPPNPATAAPATPGIPTATRAPISNSADLMANYGNSISNIESGGRYDLMGPAVHGGDRAIGKYQVMASNVPSWTQAALGTAMTPEQFRASPAAQETVFRHRFGDYVRKYGPEGAAKAWFAGEGGMNNPGARDVYGTTVSSYGRRFMQGIDQ